MKQNSLGMKLLMAAATVLVVVYFGIQGAQFFSDPLTTTRAYAYQVEEGTELSGYVVRSELVLTDDTNGLLQLRRTEGERVSANGVVAAVYADQASLDRQSEIEALSVRIEQLEYAQEAAQGAEASLKLDSQIMRNIMELRGAVEEDRLDLAEDFGAELRALVLKRDYTYSDAGDLDAEIRELKEQRKALKNQASSSTRRITAPQSGLYSAVVDGYEQALTPEMLPELTPSRLSAIKADPEVHSGVGKLILGDKWYYAAVMSVDDAAELKDTEEELTRRGRSLVLRFAKSVERGLDVKLQSIGPEEKGRCVAVFQGRTYLPELTLLRQQSAKIISSALEGIRIPKEALRASRTAMDPETGEPVTTEQTGVYCVVGREAWFKPVEVLNNGDGFLLVRSTAENEKDRLRPGDEIIVAGKQLYDEKVVR